MLKESLHSAKASLDTVILTNIIKENADIFSEFLFSDFNRSIRTSTFTSRRKQKNITVLQKGNKNGKGNYWPISILPNISKIFERFIFKQISSFMEPFSQKQQCGFRKGHIKQYCLRKENYWPVSILPNISMIFEQFVFKQISNFMEPFSSNQQCGFRKGYIKQYCLLSMFEKWKSAVGKGKCSGMLLTDLSKDSDCLSYELPLAKLDAHGFSLAVLRLEHSYLTNTKKGTKVNTDYNSW